MDETPVEEDTRLEQSALDRRTAIETRKAALMGAGVGDSIYGALTILVDDGGVPTGKVDLTRSNLETYILGLIAGLGQDAEDARIAKRSGVRHLDPDTVQGGTSGPFKEWEHDGTALIHVLWSAKHHGLDLIEDGDEIKSRILQSRWFAAAKQKAVDDSIAAV
jgi:hypothetical protein